MDIVYYKKRTMELLKKEFGYVDIIVLPFRMASVLTVLSIILNFLRGLFPILEILFISWFLDESIKLLSDDVNLTRLYYSIILVVLTVAWNWTSGYLDRIIKSRMRYRISLYMYDFLIERTAKLKYKYIEDSNTWDMIERICKDPENKIVDGYSNILELFSLVVQITGVLLLLATNAWWAVVIILAVIVPLSSIAVKSGKASYEADRDNSKLMRYCDYLSEVLMGRDSACERTLFGYGLDLDEEFGKVSREAYWHTYNVRGKWFIRRAASGMIFALISVLVIAVLLPAVIMHRISIGVFISLAGSVSGMINYVAWTLGERIDAIAKRREELKDLSAFMDLEDAQNALDEPKEPIPVQSLEFRNVSFAYPGTDKMILKNLNLTLKKNCHYAFVGVNGAGKTTLIKILTGLYDEYSGEILINGKELRTYSMEQIKATFALVYQDFARYNVTFKDNIIFNKEKYKSRLDEVLQNTGLTDVVNMLPKGVDTPMGKLENDGQDLSGGEWQRIAMARAIIDDAPVYILDEPTAALDPVSESNMYKKFESLSKDKTTIFISHRLGSTSLADIIFVLDDGKVVEQGNHDELMLKNGTYAEMYVQQRSWYE